MKTLILSAAVLSSLAGAALAQSPASSVGHAPATTVVTYADLNLEHPAGMTELRARIQAAAHQVCGERSRLLAVESRRAACFAQATDGAFRAVEARRSTLRADRRNGLTAAVVNPVG